MSNQADVSVLLGNIWIVGSCNQPNNTIAGIMLAIGVVNIIVSIWQRVCK